MNEERFFGIRQKISGATKEIWGKLTKNPRLIASGLREQRAGKHHERLGISREHALRQLKDFQQQHRDWNRLAR